MKSLIKALSLFALLPLSVTAYALDITRIPLAGTQAIVACSGEIFTAESGELQFLSREHVDGNGKVHLTYRFQIVNMWGTTNEGNVYRGAGNAAGPAPYDWSSVMLPAYPVPPDAAPIVLRRNISSRLIPIRGSDGVPSFAISRAKLTINANGTWVVDSNLEEIRCPGLKED